MNTYSKYCPNVFVAKCEERHEKGEIIVVTTKYGKENEHIVHNLVMESGGFFYYSITRADGYNVQERARRKAEKYEQAAMNADRRSKEFYQKSEKHADFLSLGEPIKVGHYSERRHRKMIKDAQNNTRKMVAEMDKAESYCDKAKEWERHSEEINLSMPESIEYYHDRLEKATAYHQAMKEGKIERSHSYSLTYAKKAVNEAQKNYDIAVKLWG